MAIINLEQLTKYYGKNRGVEKLSLEVLEGDIFGFIGPNGAGKSTTIRLMMNFIHPSAGKMSIFDKDVLKDSVEIRKRMGYLPSEVYYYDTIKVEELLNYSAKLKGVTDFSYAQSLIDAFELDVNKKFGQLSFGNKKKVGVVQAMMHKPDLLILDEPTNGLDPLVQKTLLELLREVNKKGTTVFFSSHTLSVVQKMCNRIGIIKDGRMLQTETYDSLKTRKIKKVIMEADDIPSSLIEHTEQLIERHGHYEFYYTGELSKLFSILNEMNIKDFTMHEPDLEELFMHFYMDKEVSDES